MGFLKNLLTTQDEGQGTEREFETPEEARRAAAEAALDRIIAERAAATGSANAPSAPQKKSQLAAMSDKRAGSDRREEPLAADDRRRPAAFGRRGTRPH